MSGKGLKKKTKPSRKRIPKKKSLKKEQININILNDDCLIHIFEYLSLKDRLTLEFVNRRFNAVSKLSWNHVTSLQLDYIFEEEYLLHDTLELDGWIYENKKSRASINTAFVVSVIRRASNYLTYLGIDGVNELISQLLHWKKIFEECTKYLTNITEFTIREIDITSENLKQLFENNKNLKSVSIVNFEKNIKLNTSCLMCLNTHVIEDFNITGCEIDDSNNCLLNFLSELSSLKILSISKVDCDINSVLDTLNNANIEKLNKFSMTENKSLDFEKIRNFLTKQKQLRWLHLDEIPKNLIETILSLDNLEEIYLEELNIEFLNSLHRFTNLKSLEGNVFEFTDQILQKISKCINLEKLCLLTTGFELTSEAANYFSNLKNLESLEIIDSDETEVRHCDSLLAFSKCENLTNLSISGLNFEEDSNTSLAIFDKLEDFGICESNISNELLYEIVSNSDNLLTCKIRECNNIDNEFIDLVYEEKRGICICFDSESDESNLACSCEDYYLNITYFNTNIKNYLIKYDVYRYIDLEEADFKQMENF